MPLRRKLYSYYELPAVEALTRVGVSGWRAAEETTFLAALDLGIRPPSIRWFTSQPRDGQEPVRVTKHPVGGWTNTDDGGRVIWLSADSLDEGDLRRIAAHETWHAFELLTGRTPSEFLAEQYEHRALLPDFEHRVLGGNTLASGADGGLPPQDGRTIELQGSVALGARR